MKFSVFQHNAVYPIPSKGIIHLRNTHTLKMTLYKGTFQSFHFQKIVQVNIQCIPIFQPYHQIKTLKTNTYPYLLPLSLLIYTRNIKTRNQEKIYNQSNAYIPQPLFKKHLKNNPQINQDNYRRRNQDPIPRLTLPRSKSVDKKVHTRKQTIITLKKPRNLQTQSQQNKN